MKEKNNMSNLIQKPTQSQKMRFIIPSLIGVIVFLLPVWVDGNMTIPIGIVSEFLADIIAPWVAYFMMAITVISTVGSLVALFAKPKCITENSTLARLFVCTPIFTAMRVVGTVITYMIFFEAGPEWIWSADTGGTMMDLMGTLMAWFFTASFLIPLLMDYGIMDYVGTLLRNVLTPLFHLPGRAAIDLCASWIGNCQVGVALTSVQYEDGYYTDREAALISTCFSAVSLPFCLVTAAVIGVEEYFVPLYLILTLTGILTAVIMCRIWPIGTRFKNEYYAPVGKQVFEIEPEGMKKREYAFRLAVTRAQEGPGVKALIRKGVDMFSDIIITLLPASMCIGTVALALATYTPFFDWISMPFGYYLDILGVEQAFEAAPGTLVGFADQFIPAIICADISSVETRFIICVLCLVQIIYISGPGIQIITSKIPVNFKDLVIIFLERTIISIPIIVLLTKLAGLIFGF